MFNVLIGKYNRNIVVQCNSEIRDVSSSKKFDCKKKKE